MSNHYTGKRYVPKILKDDDIWTNTKEYEALTIVPFQGNSYTSRSFVPVGIDILNKDFWACTGNYSVQIEQYRQDSMNAVNNVNSKLTTFTDEQDGKFTLLMDKYKSEINTFTSGKYDDINSDIIATNVALENTKDAITAEMTQAESNLSNTVAGYTSTANNQITTIQNMLISMDIVYNAGTTTDVLNNVTILNGGVC